LDLVRGSPERCSLRRSEQSRRTTKQPDPHQPVVPLTGPLAAPGADMVDGFRTVGGTAGGRKVEYVIADTTCNPDQAITQARRLVHQEKVHIMIGPLCG
jgi:outer membrane PBP1 activator LpoA protein